VVPRQRAHDFEFDRAAQKMRLHRRSHADLAHDRRVLRKDVDESFFAELHQRVAHGRLAEAVARCEFCARQHRTGLQFERKDHFAQPLENLRRGVAGAVEAMDRGGSGVFHVRGKAVRD
jgi:hypothetical protein